MTIFRRLFGGRTNPICSRCDKELQIVDMKRSAVVIGNLPTLYSGVVCSRCGKTECVECKRDTGIDSNCSWCGSRVSPAYRHLI